jgi:hypothetical protein
MLLSVPKDSPINLMPQASPVLSKSKHAELVFKRQVAMHMFRFLTTIMDDLSRYDANPLPSEFTLEETNCINH